jgi:hypothetical protein
MPAVLSTLRLGEFRKKNEEKNAKTRSRRKTAPSLEDFVTITIEMKENQNPRPLPNANNLSKNNVLTLHDEVKILLPPKTISSQKSEEVLINTSGDSESLVHSTTSMLSVNAPEFTPKLKVHSLNSSRENSPFKNSPFKNSSTMESKSSSATLESFSRPPCLMTLPCIGIDNKLRQYLWRIDKVGDLMPVFNKSIPPPRIVAHGSFFGPSIVVPVHSNFKYASGGLIMNQFHHIQTPSHPEGRNEKFKFLIRNSKFCFSENRGKSSNKIFVDASVSVHPSDFETCVSCDVSCQTEENELGKILEGKI